MKIDEALNSLREGKFVLLHDGNEREDEVDMIIPAQYIRPEHIATMRRDAGGLICVAIDYNTASRLELKYMHEILRDYDYDGLVYKKTPYGEEPSFSLTINHRDTYTGVTDKDRALTISRISEICKLTKEGYARDKFFADFKVPGHVHLLIARKGLLDERNGHTELSITLAMMADIIPAVAMCEMLDADTHEALSVEKAKEYSDKHNLVVISADEVRASSRLSRYG